MAVHNASELKFLGTKIVLNFTSVPTIVNGSTTGDLDLDTVTLKFGLSKVTTFATSLEELVYSKTPKLEKTEGSGISKSTPAFSVTVNTADTVDGNANGIKAGYWFWEIQAVDGVSQNVVVATGVWLFVNQIVNT